MTPRFLNGAIGVARRSPLRGLRRLEHCTFSHTAVVRHGMRRSSHVRQHSALPNEFAVYSCPSIILRSNGTSTASSNTIPFTDLRALFVAAAVPMVGFGFMDQFVLIQAGGYIDATLGVKLGLATLSAAAAGQVISDVSGVVFGGALERFLTTRTSWLPAPNLTAVQRQLPLCRNVAMAGAVCGVILGCALGATTLLAVDLEARHRIERAQRLRDIVQDMIGSSSAGSVGVEVDRPFCDACTVHIVSTKDLTLPDQAESSKSSRTVTLQDLTVGTPDERAAVQRCIQSRTIAVQDGVLYAPVLRSDTVMAVVAFSNLHDRNEADEERFFPQEADVVTARVMARHIAIFMDRLAE